MIEKTPKLYTVTPLLYVDKVSRFHPCGDWQL